MDKAIRLDQIHRAMERLRGSYVDVEIIGLRVNDQWKVEEV